MIAYSVERKAFRKNKKCSIIDYPLFAMRYPLILMLSLIIFLASLVIAEAAPVFLAEELLKEAEKYDEKEVIYKGEVIGDIIIRRYFAWINVRDETRAI